MKKKTKTALRVFVGMLALGGLASCASFQGAEVADYNGDGVISDAELRQYQKVARVQATNIGIEGAKRENAVRTAEGAGRALRGVEGALNSISRMSRRRY